MSTRLDRRIFLKSATLAGVSALGTTAVGCAFPRARAQEPGAPFQHSVASGDPLPHAVIIWTRVTPTPEAQPGSGLGPDTRVA